VAGVMIIAGMMTLQDDRSAGCGTDALDL